MKIAFFDTHRFERSTFENANKGRHDITFLEARLDEKTAGLAKGCDVVCCFVNDHVDRETTQKLAGLGVRLVATRSAGFNHIDTKALEEFKIPLVTVPEYSPHAVAEHAVTLLQTLNRKTHKAHNRIRDLNFALDGLVGFDLYGKTVGVIGTGRIGKVFCQIMRGFGTNVLAVDMSPDLGWASKNEVRYVEMEELLTQSDVISLHVPLTPKTHHLIDSTSIEKMKKTVILVNTSRGGLIETRGLIKALKLGKIGGACLDVYEEESGIFFNDLSERGVNDDILARLITFPNVLITSHQAFLTNEALSNIAATTIRNITDFEMTMSSL